MRITPHRRHSDFVELADRPSILGEQTSGETARPFDTDGTAAIPVHSGLPARRPGDGIPPALVKDYVAEAAGCLSARGNYAELLQFLIDTAKQLKHRSDRIKVLVSVADAQRRLGADPEPTLQAAFSEAKRPDSTQIDDLHQVANGLAKANLNPTPVLDALFAASLQARKHDPFSGIETVDSLLAAAAMRIALHQDPTEALDAVLAGILPWAEDEGFAETVTRSLLKVAQLQAQAKIDPASTLERALATASLVEGREDRALMLVELGTTYATLGFDPAEPFRAAFVAAPDLHDPCNVLLSLAGAQVAAGRDPTDTVALADRLTLPFERVWMRTHIAWATIEAERDPTKPLEAAFETARQLNFKAGPLTRIARLQIAAKQDPTKTLASAYVLAMSETHPTARCERLIEIAKLQVLAGLDAAHTFENALADAIESHKNLPLHRTLLVLDVASAQVEARQDPARAFEVAESIIGTEPGRSFPASDCAEALTRLAKVKLAAGYDGRDALEAALSSVEEERFAVPDAVLVTIARIQGAVGQDETATLKAAVSSARETAERVESDDGVVELLLAICAPQDSTQR